MGKSKFEIGKIIASIRQDLGLSLAKVAARSGLHRTTISLIEHGEREPTIETASLIAEALGTSLLNLLSASSASLERHQVKPECIRSNNVDSLQVVNLTPEAVIGGIKHCYRTLDIIDEQLIRNGAPRLSELVELANLSSIVGNLIGAGVASSSNGIFVRNKPHTYPDLIYADKPGGIEIKVALENNKPKGHLPKEGYYLTYRYVLANSPEQYIKGKNNRGHTVYVWEVRFGYLKEDDFSCSNTEGDSGKTAVIKTDSLNSMKLIYFDPFLAPVKHSERRPYKGYN